MAILSNINDKFAVDSTGAIQFNGQAGTSGYVLKSNGNAAPTWVDASTVIGGPYLPLSGGTLTGATATASGISFTVGGTLTGTTATFSGSVTIDSSTATLNIKGSNTGARLINFADSDDGNVGRIYYDHTNNFMQFKTNDSEKMRIDSSGVVSITNSADASLKVETSSGTNSSRLFLKAPTREWRIGVNDSFNSGSLFVYNTEANTYPFIIDTNGNAGIGTTSPSSLLHISKNSSNSQLILERTGSSTGKFKIYTNTNSLFIYDDAQSSHRMKIDSSGNVGIGTTNPTRNLTIGNGSGNSVLAIVAATNGLSQIGLGDSDDDNYGQIILRHSDGLLQIQNGGGGGISERGLNITSSEDIGIGTTSPVTPLHVTGTGLQDMQAWFGNGFVNNASYHYSFAKVGFSSYSTIGNDTGAGFQFNTRNSGNSNWMHGYIYQPQNGGIAFGTGGAGTTSATERMRINSDGNVGIGITNPAFGLVVARNATSGTINDGVMIGMETTTNGGNAGYRFKSGGEYYQVLYNGSNIQWKNYDSGYNTKMTLTNDGNLGIGTTSPSAKLNVVDGNGTYVSSDANAYPRFTQAGGSVQLGLFRSSSNVGGGYIGADGGTCFHVRDASFATKLYLTQGGNLGIGTTSPAQKLDVVGKMKISDDIKLAQTNGRIDYDNGVSTGALRFWSTSGNSERMRITSAGNVGIGNTSPQTTLHTGPTTTITNTFTARFAASNFFASGGNSMFYVPDTAANIMMFGSNQLGTNQIEFYHKNPGTSQSYVGRISTSGSATSYVTSSDYRLKENIVPINDSISRLNQLKPSRFNFIEEPNKTVDGFIAHEVQNIVPEAIVGKKDAVNKDGSIIPQGIDQAKLVPLLVAAVQELEARVKELENK